MVRFFESNKVAINSLFLDFDSKDTMMVYSMDDLYHLIQRIADTVRRRVGSEVKGEREFKSRGYSAECMHVPFSAILYFALLCLDKWLVIFSMLGTYDARYYTLNVSRSLRNTYSAKCHYSLTSKNGGHLLGKICFSTVQVSITTTWLEKKRLDENMKQRCIRNISI